MGNECYTNRVELFSGRTNKEAFLVKEIVSITVNNVENEQLIIYMISILFVSTSAKVISVMYGIINYFEQSLVHSNLSQTI